MNRDLQPTPVKPKRTQKKYWREIKGHLYARLQYQDDSGKWKEKLRPITDKRLALRTVEEMRRELDLHGQEVLVSNKLTFDELAEKYLTTQLVEAQYSNGVKISGRRSLRPVQSSLKPLRDFFGNKILRSIKTSEIDSFKKMRLTAPTPHGSSRKVASVNRELEILRAMFNFALQNEWLIKNPFALSKGLISKAAEVERDRVLSFDEERRLLSVSTGRRGHLKGLLICALDTAMRRGEIFKMRWQDVDFESNEIRIPQTNTKTEEARTVGITPRLRQELEYLWETSAQNKSLCVFGITDSIKTAFSSACKEANISDFRFHDCRHTATTRMIASGSPHTEVMKITGHSQMKTFLRYLNITSETTNNVASRLHVYFSDRQLVIDSVSESIN